MSRLQQTKCVTKYCDIFTAIFCNGKEPERMYLLYINNSYVMFDMVGFGMGKLLDNTASFFNYP